MADPFYTCCEDGMLSQVPPTDRSGLCPTCRPARRTRDVAGILRFLTPQQMAEEIVRLDAVIAGQPNIQMGRVPPGAGASDEAQAHDARRYRFLRDAAHPDTNGGLRCVGNCADSGQPLHISGRDLDRAVDAAAAGNVVDPTACPECIGMGCEACNGTGDAPTMKAKCDGNHGGPRCADPECWNDDSVGAMSGPASLTELRRLIADDAYAMTFQTFGQYRSALLKAAYTITAHGVLGTSNDQQEQPR